MPRVSCIVIVLPPSAFSPEIRCRTIARARPIVDAAVLEETIVFGREHRVDHLIRDRVEGERNAALLAELRDEAAIAAIDAQRHLEANVLDRRNVRQARPQVLVGAQQRKHRPAKQHNPEREGEPQRRGKVTSNHNRSS
jgi:hypothetical protein